MSLIFNHTDKEHWNSIPKQHWVHTWEYGLIQTSAGRTVSHLVIRSQKGGHAVAYATLITYPLLRNKTITYLPYGPVWLEEPSQEFLQSVREHLYRYGRTHNSIVVRLELPRPLSGTIPTPWSLYRSSFHQPRGEAGLDLDHPIEDITASFSKNTVRNIKKSYKHDLETEILSGQQMLEQQDAFIQLNQENARAHNTTTHSPAYFEQLFNVLKENPHNFLITVRDQDGPVAMNIFTVFGDHAYCPFGASNSRGKQLSAYYHIKDQAIKHLHTNHIIHFNWGGIAVGKRDHNLSGLNQFKLGWGTEQTLHHDLYDIIINPLWYSLYLLRNVTKNLYHNSLFS